MPRIIRKKQSGQAAGLILFFGGLVILLAVFWKAWPHVSNSADIPSSFLSYLLNEQINVATVLDLKLLYISVAGTFILVAGLVTLVLSREIFYSSSESVSLKCPYCKSIWKARRALGWAECPYCRKFIQPQVAKPAT